MHQVDDPTTARRRAPELVALDTHRPDLATLYRFMADAELRFESLRLRIIDRRHGSSGESTETTEVWLRHPGFAKVIQARGAATSRDFDVWVVADSVVQTYVAQTDVTTTRRAPLRPVGATDPRLPLFARLYVPLTPLPAETLADTFIHPHGFCRNVLSTGVTRITGTADRLGGREQILLRCDHPRTSHVLTDRPDHWMEVAVDAQTGMITALIEHIGGRITRQGEVTSIGLDETIGDEAFRVHVSTGTRALY